MTVSVEDMLKARDDRVKKQKELLEKYKTALICFTMNIAGDEKQNPLIKAAFQLGINEINAQLEAENIKVLFFFEDIAFTGCTAYFAVDFDAVKLKKLTSEIEDSTPVGRLFDIDIIDKSGKKISRGEIGLTSRKCLICQNDAMVCSSRRAHSLSELKAKTDALLFGAVSEDAAQKIAATAVRALLYEVCTTPKPGLVDLNNNGSHTDMNIFTFMDSAAVLFPYFKECAALGIKTRLLPPEETFKKIRLKGKIAQKKMFDETGGINTHKGAVFSLGLLSAAGGRLFLCEDLTSQKMLFEVSKMANGITAELKGATSTAGGRIFGKYGITGVRGQAEAGFPAVKEYGLPVLCKAIQNGLSLNDAGSIALLYLICNTDDTNIINRSDAATAKQIKKKISDILEKSSLPDVSVIDGLDKEFIRKNLSAGGSADLLSVCYFLYFYIG